MRGIAKGFFGMLSGACMSLYHNRIEYNQVLKYLLYFAIFGIADLSGPVVDLAS